MRNMEESGSEKDVAGGPDEVSGSSRKTFCIIALVAVLACAGVLLVLYLCVWRGDSKSDMEKGYEKNWRSEMKEFDDRLSEDDKKAEAFLEKEDLSSVIILVRERIAYLEEFIGRFLDLYPPPDLRRLHVATLHYLYTLVDQLETQNDLNEAVLAGNPTTDLKAIADNAVLRSQQAFKDLTIEMQKAGVVIGDESTETPKDNEPSGQTPTGQENKQQ